MNEISVTTPHAVEATTAVDFSSIKTLDQAEVKGRRVLMRADLNVPMPDGVVADATRIKRVLPTIRRLLERGASVVVLSHGGRAKGRQDTEGSLKPVAAKVQEGRAETPVLFIVDCAGEEAK